MAEEKFQITKEQAKRAELFHSVYNKDPGAEVLDDLRLNFSTQLSYMRRDPTHTAFQEGARAVVFYIEDQLRIHNNPLAEVIEETDEDKENKE